MLLFPHPEYTHYLSSFKQIFNTPNHQSATMPLAHVISISPAVLPSAQEKELAAQIAYLDGKGMAGGTNEEMLAWFYERKNLRAFKDKLQKTRHSTEEYKKFRELKKEIHAAKKKLQKAWHDSEEHKEIQKFRTQLKALGSTNDSEEYIMYRRYKRELQALWITRTKTPSRYSKSDDSSCKLNFELSPILA
jgi:hypothetical protein